jgi:hypothetical protein
MMILYGFGDFRPFWRVQAWAVAHLIPVHCMSGDFRGTIAALALHAFAALEAFAQRQLMSLARNVMVRAWQGLVSRPIWPLLTPRWQQGMASLKRLLKKSGAST